MLGLVSICYVTINLSLCTCVGSRFHLSCNDEPNRPTNEEEIRNTTQKVITTNKHGIKNKTPTNKWCNFHRKRHCTYSHSDAGSTSPVTLPLLRNVETRRCTMFVLCTNIGVAGIYKNGGTSLVSDLACDIAWPTERQASATAQHELSLNARLELSAWMHSN